VAEGASHEDAELKKEVGLHTLSVRFEVFTSFVTNITVPETYRHVALLGIGLLRVSHMGFYSTLKMEAYFPLIIRMTFNGLRDYTPQDVHLFINTIFLYMLF
jgi:hypothetical protein